MGREATNNNEDVSFIISEIDKKYGTQIKGQELLDIEILELKDGKVNYVFKYAEATFVIYFNPPTKTIIVLNAIDMKHLSNEHSLSKEGQDADEAFHNALVYILSSHPQETEDYKVMSVRKSEDESYCYFSVELESHGKKYRSQVKVLKSDNEIIEEISWSEIVAIALDHFRLDTANQWFISHFTKLSQEELEDPFMNVINEYALTQNSLPEDTHLIGIMSRPQNLGYFYRLIYRLKSTELAYAEVYAETTTSRMKSISFELLDFESNLMKFSTEGEQTKKILEAIERKITSSHETSDFAVSSIEGKEFVFGNLFVLEIKIQEETWEAVMYHDHSSEEIHLFQWALRPSGRPCEMRDGKKCTECSAGYFMDTKVSLCFPTIPGCSAYIENNTECQECEDGLQMINKICTSDCGSFCGWSMIIVKHL